ncbi:MAG TPA: tyrosine-type recombinase/integrase [Urbifossiella sp.]|nr:tyrosine-type recombinase/integrase [Urbifossiella sp.]
MAQNHVPSYLLHKQSGRARAYWTDGNGVQQFKLLPGPFDSPESRRAYHRLCLEIEASPFRHLSGKLELSVAQLFDAYLQFAKEFYRGPAPERKMTSSVGIIQCVMKSVLDVYQDTPAAEFRPHCLEAMKTVWVNEGRSRRSVNRRIWIVKGMFKWAVPKELVEPSVYLKLKEVDQLKINRSKAPEKQPIRPVSKEVVDATLPFLNRYVSGIVQFMWHTGCRPGEACDIRRIDIDMNGDGKTWVYTPPYHKNQWRGHARPIFIGAQGQAILKDFFTVNIGEPLFAPTKAVKERNEARSMKRTTPLYPSHAARNAAIAARKKAAKWQCREKYDKDSLHQAIERACDRAFPAPPPLAQIMGETVDEWQARLTFEDQLELKAWRKKHVLPEHLRQKPGETAAQLKGRLSRAEKVELKNWHKAHKLELDIPQHLRKRVSRMTPEERLELDAWKKAHLPRPHLLQRKKETKAEWMERLTPEQRLEVKAWRKAHRWHPNQIRHARATLIDRQFGAGAAQQVLGHSDQATTQIYIEKNFVLAKDIAAKIG